MDATQTRSTRRTRLRRSAAGLLAGTLCLTGATACSQDPAVGERPETPAQQASAGSASASAEASRRARARQSVGSELAPTPATSPTTLPDLGPPVSVAPLAPRPWPTGGVARGRLAPGTPEPLSQLRGSTVLSSSVTTDGSRLQVSLQATTTRPVSWVLRGYARRWSRHGLTEAPVPATAGTRAMAYSSGGTSAVVAASRASGTTTYAVHAVVLDED